MIRIITVLSAFFILQGAWAQKPFKINEKGEVISDDLKKIIKKRNYHAVSAFDTFSFNPPTVFALYIKNNKLGIIDIFGKEITAAIYDDIPALNRDYTISMVGFHEGITVELNNKYGLIDRYGKVIIPLKYDYIDFEKYIYDRKSPTREYLRDSLYKARLGDSIFMINAKGKIVNSYVDSREDMLSTEYSYTPRKTTEIPLQKSDTLIAYDHQKNYSSHVIVKRTVNHRFLYGIMDSVTKEIVLPLEFQGISTDFNKNYIVTRSDKKAGIIDSTGKNTIVAFEYESIQVFSRDKTFSFRKNGKFALFDKNYKSITEFKYERQTASLGNARINIVSSNGKYGILTSDGKELSEFIYDGLSFIENSLKDGEYVVIAEKNGKKGILDTLGKVLLPLEHDKLVPWCLIEPDSYSTEFKGFYFGGIPYCGDNEYYLFKKNGKVGVYDLSFKVIADSFDMIVRTFDNQIIVSEKINNKSRWGVYSLEAQKIVIPIEYESIERSRGGYFNYSEYYSGQLFVVKLNGLYGIFNETGKVIMPPIKERHFEADLIYNGLIKLEYSRDHVGYVDYNGNVVN